MVFQKLLFQWRSWYGWVFTEKEDWEGCAYTIPSPQNIRNGQTWLSRGVNVGSEAQESKMCWESSFQVCTCRQGQKVLTKAVGRIISFSSFLRDRSSGTDWSRVRKQEEMQRSHMLSPSLSKWVKEKSVGPICVWRNTDLCLEEWRETFTWICGKREKKQEKEDGQRNRLLLINLMREK